MCTADCSFSTWSQSYASDSSRPLTALLSCFVQVQFFLVVEGAVVRALEEEEAEGAQGSPGQAMPSPEGLGNCKGFHIFTLKPINWQKLN